MISSLISFMYLLLLCLTYSEHLCSASRANTLGRRFAVLHGDGFGILHLFFGTAFDTVRLHLVFSPYQFSFPILQLKISCLIPVAQK